MTRNSDHIELNETEVELIAALADHSSPENAELLPCPFCGNQPTLENWDDGKGVSIHCRTFMCPLDDVEIPDLPVGEVRKRWNKRPSIRAQQMTDHPDDEDHMVRISALIARLQSTLDQFGDTCVYIRRGGLSWGAVALNRQDDDRKHGVFDLQAQHDRDMEQRAGQVERLIADRNRWMERAMEAEAKAPALTSPECEPLAKLSQCPRCLWWSNAPKSHADSCQFKDSGGADTLIQPQRMPSPPKALHWLGDRESSDATRHALDMTGCVMYFEQQSDCLQFMRWVEALSLTRPECGDGS